jgi:hypothetical protein
LLSNKAYLGTHLQIHDLGPVKRLLGMEVRRDQARRRLSLTQAAYSALVLRRFGMADCKAGGTPIPAGFDAHAQGEPLAEQANYRELVGCLMHLASCTRPDIAAAVGLLSRYNGKATGVQWTAAMHVLRYVRGSVGLGLVFRAGEGVNVPAVYCDASYASDPNSRRSTTGFAILLNGAVVAWGSKLQTGVALSATEAEYVAVGYACKVVVYVRRLLGDLGIDVRAPTVVFEDNQAVISIASAEALSKRLRHVDIQYHYIHEKVADGTVTLVYRDGEQQAADILTKLVDRGNFERHRATVMGIDQNGSGEQ